jgi:hypothetical protein
MWEEYVLPKVFLLLELAVILRVSDDLVAYEVHGLLEY